MPSSAKLTTFFTISNLQKDWDPGSGSDITDFYFEDPDPKLIILNPDHWLKHMSEDELGTGNFLLWVKHFARYLTNLSQ